MSVAIRIDITEENTPNLTVRSLPRIMRIVYRDLGEFWQRTMLPEHFKPSARFKYQHKPRTRKYLQRKFVLAKQGKVQDGGRTDNVFSGLLRRSMLQRHVVRAYPTRVNIRMIGPSYITMQPRDPKKPNKAREILTVTGSEASKLDQRSESTFLREYKRLRVKRKKRVS